MALGFLGVSYTSAPLPYNDEETPVLLAGKKMLPIFEWDSGDRTNESLDIIARLDEKDALSQGLLQESAGEELNQFLAQISAPKGKLFMPHVIWTIEFNDVSRQYFKQKKEARYGPFKELFKNQKMLMEEIKEPLENLGNKVGSFYQGEKLTILDIILASHLWGLYAVPEFQFTPTVHSYLQRVKEQCHFNYYQDFI